MSRSNSAVEAELQFIEQCIENEDRRPYPVMRSQRPSVTDAILEAALVLLMLPLAGIFVTLVIVSIQQ